MSKYSAVVDGKVLDYIFKRQNNFTVAFYVGDILIGQIFKMNRKYSAVIWHNIPDNSALLHVKGFATRLDAAEYMLDATIYSKK